MIPFSGNPLDRANDRRNDAAFLAAKWRDPESLVLPMWRLQPFLLGPESAAAPLQAGLLKPGVADALAAPDAACIFLGLEGERAWFALDISAAPDPATVGPLAGLGHFRDMRSAASLLPPGEVAILGHAKALIDWHQRHGFCPRCGAATVLVAGGHRRDCPGCKAEHFPRTDPVVIMLATEGDSCLLGRGKHFPSRMFSALAGFVEPGETIEEAVVREIFEETRVKTGAVAYFTTQPWPFPSSLMIGCFAKAKGREIHLDDNELAEAIWLDRATARALLAGERVRDFFLPPPIAIAHHLIRHWVEEDAS